MAASARSETYVAAQPAWSDPADNVDGAPNVGAVNPDSPGEAPAGDNVYPHDSWRAGTGMQLRPFVVLGGGLLAFGVFILGLAWVLGRRSPID